jgi:hypothetical protein
VLIVCLLPEIVTLVVIVNGKNLMQAFVTLSLISGIKALIRGGGTGLSGGRVAPVSAGWSDQCGGGFLTSWSSGDGSVAY